MIISDPLVARDDVEKFIPHRQPFVMVHSLLRADEQFFETLFTVESTNLFVQDLVLQEGALIENIAQSCALGFGFADRRNGLETPKSGYIGAVNRVVVSQLPKVGTMVSTQVEIRHRMDNLFLVKGVCRAGSQDLLECEMKIVVV